MHYSRDYVHKSNVIGTGLLAFAAGIVVWAMFGKKLKDTVNQSSEFQDLKKQIYDKASEVTDLTQDKYDSIVDDLSGKYAQAKGISQNELRDLVSDLKWHWKRIKSSWDNNRYSGQF